MNPLQPKVIKRLETVFHAFVTNIISTSKGGTGDIIACIKGQYYMFEIKYGKDRLSDLQRDKINRVINAGGKAYVITELSQIDEIILNDINPQCYPIPKTFEL